MHSGECERGNSGFELFLLCRWPCSWGNAWAISSVGGPSIFDGDYTRGAQVTVSGDAIALLGQVAPAITRAAIDEPGPAHISLPPKLMKRILNLEFIEIGELFPEAWGGRPGSTDMLSPSGAAPTVRLVRPWLDHFLFYTIFNWEVWKIITCHAYAFV